MDEPSLGTTANTNVLFRACRFPLFFCANVAVCDGGPTTRIRYPTNVVLDRAAL
jgi:hypothetical protein